MGLDRYGSDLAETVCDKLGQTLLPDIVGLVMVVWLIAEADNVKSCLHCCLALSSTRSVYCRVNSVDILLK